MGESTLKSTESEKHLKFIKCADKALLCLKIINEINKTPECLKDELTLRSLKTIKKILSKLDID